MKHRLFITGGTGFVGRELLKSIDFSQYERVVCLARKRPQDGTGAIQWVQGDLLEPASYSSALDGISVVLHLAAATGKTSRAGFLRANVEGTRSLVNSMRERGATRLLYVSSIAARFADSYYHYGHSKAAAEEIVKNSGLSFTIVRPTIILGKGSPVLQGLRGLANAPVIPIFGNGRTQVQPIAVEDLVSALLQIIESGRFQGETLELGGPEVVTIENLLLRIRDAHKGGSGAVIHLPVKPIRACLAAMEPFLLRVMPLTAGQLASFVNAGVAEPNSFSAQLHSMSPLEKTLRVAM